jgi:mRNA interferase RelE/StbE
MSLTIRYHKAVISEDIPKLPKTTKERVKSAIKQKLETSPEVFGKPLRKSLKGYRKLRIGNYRVVFRLANKAVFILGIIHRDRVYDRIQNRFE